MAFRIKTSSETTARYDLRVARKLSVSFVARLFAATIGYSIGLDSGVFRNAAAVLMIAVGAILLVPRFQARPAFARTPLVNLSGRYVGVARQGGLLWCDASDSRSFETLLAIGHDIDPRAAPRDKGYDSTSNREAARQRGICSAIPYRSNTKDMLAFFPKASS